MKNSSVKSTNFRIGKKTFFFDVNVASNDSKYLRVTESRFVEEGKDRIRNSVVLFPEDVQDFQKKLERDDRLSQLNYRRAPACKKNLIYWSALR